MEEPVTQSVEFDVNLPKSRPVSVLAKLVFGIGVLALVGAIVAVVVSRTAAPVVDPTVKVLPPDTMLLMSLNTRSDQLPNYNVVADAWKGSPEAKQIESALKLAIIQAGFNWEDDIQPWLGERITFGLLDLGNYTRLITTSEVHGPTYYAVVQTRDRAKSDAFLVNVRKEIESKLTPSDYVTTTLHDDTYRGVAIVSLTSESHWFGAEKSTTSDVVAYATVNDVIVVTTNADNLKKAIDASLDGNNLSLNAKYQTTMNSLPGQTAFAMYMDFNQYMQAVMTMTLGISQQFGNLGDAATPNVSKQLEQLQKAQDTLNAMGGIGVAMTYEPTGLRFDTAAQIDLAKLPEAQRQMYEASYKAAANKVFESIPQVAMAVLSGNNPAGYLNPFFDPNQPDPFANLPGMGSETFRDKIAQLEKLAGVNLKTDLIDLLNGEFAFIVSPKVQTVSDSPDSALKDMPFEFALLFDSSDAARASATLDKLVQAVAEQSKGDVKWQPLSGLPYSAVLLDNSSTPAFIYGVVDGRLVIGSTSDTLLRVQNAKPSPITNDATFKTAVGLLPGNRVQTGYLNLQPLWTMIKSEAKQGDTTTSAVLNYLGHFQWVSTGSGVPTDKLVKSEVHIGVGK
ncbi:MAG: DUF3352 domain-containing protein [Anaerolineae bacterium]